MKTYAQHGDDIFILNLFRSIGIEKFSWIDLGAHHPERISNTKLFYDMGMRGVNVEPNRHLIEVFDRERPEDMNLKLAVSGTFGLARYYFYDEESAINTLIEEKAKLFEQQGAEYPDSYIVETVPLNHIINFYCNDKFPEFLNCDIEDMDYMVLEATDFSETYPLVACVEVRPKDSAKFTGMMKDKGFSPWVRLWENLVYVHSDIENLLNSQLGW